MLAEGNPEDRDRVGRSPVEIDGQRVAVYRDKPGALRALLGVRTHLVCVIQCNGLAQSWESCDGEQCRLTREGLCAPPTQVLTCPSAEEEEKIW